MKAGEIPSLSPESIKINNLLIKRIVERGFKGHLVGIIEYNIRESKEDVDWIKERIAVIKRRLDHNTEFQASENFLDLRIGEAYE